MRVDFEITFDDEATAVGICTGDDGDVATGDGCVGNS